MALRTFARRLLIGSGALGVAAVTAYSDDLTDLQFDAATAAGHLLKLLDAENAHAFGIWAARHGLVPRERRPDPPCLRTAVWGRTFRNPIGLAAGFDKDAEGVEGLLGMGFGFVEIGSVTPLPQPGNPKPRVFRLPELDAVINRYGFNSDGVDAVAANMAAFRRREAAGSGLGLGSSQTPAAPADAAAPSGRVGVNLGKNKARPLGRRADTYVHMQQASSDAAGDYAIGAAKLARHADYLVINVSSPNTPGLRALQGRKELERLVRRCQAARDAAGPWGAVGPPPLLVKVAPDLTEADKADIAAVSLRTGVDGLIVSNTTLARPKDVADHPTGDEVGGLSGKPLLEPSTAVLRDMYRLTKGRLPIIGVGGVSTGQDAYTKIRAGASLVQVYSSLAYGGPAVVPRMKRELAACLRRDGYGSVAEAVGADHRKPGRA